MCEFALRFPFSPSLCVSDVGETLKGGTASAAAAGSPRGVRRVHHFSDLARELLTEVGFFLPCLYREGYCTF